MNNNYMSRSGDQPTIVCQPNKGLAYVVSPGDIIPRLKLTDVSGGVFVEKVSGRKGVRAFKRAFKKAAAGLNGWRSWVNQLDGWWEPAAGEWGSLGNTGVWRPEELE